MSSTILFAVTLQHGKTIAYEVIVYAARELSADLLVIGTHSKWSIFDVALGGTAPYVCRHASCPVVPDPGRQAHQVATQGPSAFFAQPLQWDILARIAARLSTGGRLVLGKPESLPRESAA